MLDRQSGNTTFSQNIPAVSSDIDKNNIEQTPLLKLAENVIQTPLVELTESVIQTPPVELTENDKMLTDDSNKENFIKKMEESTLEPIQEENDLELDEFISRIDLIDDNIKDKDTKSETQSTISSKKKKNPFNKVLSKLKKKTNIDESEN